MQAEERTEEREALADPLRQAQKMEAIGTLAGGIAHDFNNILTPIMAHGELALMELPESDPVLAVPSRLQQVILNLCTNVSYAMAGRGGVLAMSLARLEEPGGPARVRLAVSDTGPGMAPDVRARIFEPYFTTKPAGKGSGLGLAVVHGIVAGLGGEIRVTSAPPDLPILLGTGFAEG